MNNVRVEPFIDGTFAGTLAVVNIPDGVSGNIEFGIRIPRDGLGGWRTLEVRAGSSRVSRAFEWQTLQFAELVTFDLINTVVPLIAAEQNGTGFSVFVANVGGRPTPLSTEMDFFVRQNGVDQLRRFVAV